MATDTPLDQEPAGRASGAVPEAPPPAPSSYPPPSYPPPAPSSYPPPGSPPYFSPSLPSYPPWARGIDTPSPIPGVPSLPPGVTLATPGRRIGAYFLGLLLLIVTLVVGYIVWGLLVWRRGTTPALSVLKMRCLKVSDGTRATFATMALREIVGRVLEGILGWLTELASLVLFLGRADHRCIHDLVASTIVVFDPEGRLDPPS